jgi:hypothetical protein
MIRSVRPYMSYSSLLKISYSLFHSILSYNIIYLGQATYTKKLFWYRKNAVCLITGFGNRFSCRNIFRQLGILPLKSQYIYSVLLFVLKNRKLFTTNYDTHNLQTRQSNNLYPPTSTLAVYQKGVYFTGIKLLKIYHLKSKRL